MPEYLQDKLDRVMKGEEDINDDMEFINTLNMIDIPVEAIHKWKYKKSKTIHPLICMRCHKLKHQMELIK